MAQSQSTGLSLRIRHGGKDAELRLSNGSVSGSDVRGRPTVPDVSGYDILWAEVEGNNIEFSYVDRRVKGKARLARIYARVLDENLAKDWCEKVMQTAYADVKQRRRLRVLVNPCGGRGKARQIHAETVEPIFRAARCICDTTFTEKVKHAEEIAKTMPLDYDAIVLLSGDGLIHEVYNGYAAHAEPLKAFSIPVAPIPTGSGNGTSINLLGLDDGLDVTVAALNAIKGKPMRQDICSMTFSGKQRIYTFMSQAMGLMADLDLGTEHLRWIGDTRFVLGFLHGVFKLKQCPIRLSIKIAEKDKDKLLQTFHESRRTDWEDDVGSVPDYIDAGGSDGGGLPPLKHTGEASDDNNEGWITFDKPMIYLYAGMAPYVGRDLMQFPVAQASDGYIDIVAQELTTRANLLKSIDGAEKGKTFWNHTSHYFKAHAYRVTPLTSRGNLSVDGEAYPFGPFEVEVHKGLATLMSPFGRYAAEFNVPKPEKKGQSRSQASESGFKELNVMHETSSPFKKVFSFLSTSSLQRFLSYIARVFRSLSHKITHLFPL